MTHPPEPPEETPDWQRQAQAAGWTPPVSGQQPQQPAGDQQPQQGYPQPQQGYYQPYYDPQYYQQPYGQPYYQQPQYQQPYYPQPYYQQPPYGQQPYPSPYGQPPYPPQRPARPEHPHSEPRSYALVLRNWNYHWWKPLVGVLLFVVGALIVLPLVLIPVLLIGIAFEGPSATYVERLDEASLLESITPSAILYLNLVLASLIPLSMVLVRVLHGMRPRWLSSVVPGMRWKFMFACFGVAVVCMVLAVLLGLVLPTDPAESTGSAAFPTGELLVIAIIVLLTTPLQAIGEEYAFRGYLLQAFGAWARNPWLAVAVTSLLFALAHGAQNFPLFFDRLTFGLIAGVTVVLLGGLEAGIAMHVVNNLVAFGFAIAFDELAGSLAVSEISYWQIPVTLVQHGSYLVLVLLLARRMKLQRRSAPPQPAAEQAVPQPA